MTGFFESSSSVSLAGSVLSAQCLDEQGNNHFSSLDLNSIFGNDNGSFQFGGTGWFSSAQGTPSLNGSILTAFLLNVAGQLGPASVDLDSFIFNNNGSLQVAAV